MFSLKKWGEKTAKAAIAALVLVLFGDRAQGILQPVFQAAGWELTPERATAALFAGWLSLANGLKHQSWVPGVVKWVL